MRRRGDDPSLEQMGLVPQVGSDLPSLFEWLERVQLTREASVFDRELQLDLPGGPELRGGWPWRRQPDVIKRCHCTAKN